MFINTKTFTTDDIKSIDLESNLRKNSFPDYLFPVSASSQTFVYNNLHSKSSISVPDHINRERIRDELGFTKYLHDLNIQMIMTDKLPF